MYIDFRSIINFQVHLLFLAVGLLEDKVCEINLVNVYIFQQPLPCLKQDDFKITQAEERKGTKDYIKISLLVQKIASCFEIFTNNRYYSIFVIEFVPSGVRF